MFNKVFFIIFSIFIYEIKANITIIHQDEYYIIYDFKEDDYEVARYIAPSNGVLKHGIIYLNETDIIIMEYMKMIMSSLLIQPDPHNILFIGLGVGILPRTFSKYLPNSKIDIVELDKHIYDLAIEYFYFKNYSNINVHIQDGYDYVMELNETIKYDLIILDVFTDQHCSPKAFTTEIFFNEIKKHLNNNGLFVKNSITYCIHDMEDLISFKNSFNYLYISDDIGADQIILASQNSFPSFKNITNMANNLNEFFSKLSINTSDLIKVFHFDKKPYLGSCYLYQDSFLHYINRNLSFQNDYKIF